MPCTQAKEASHFQEDQAQEILMQEIHTVGSLTPGLADPLTRLPLTCTVHHLAMATPETHMLPKVGIPMLRQVGNRMHHLAEQHTRYQGTNLLTVPPTLKHLPPGRRNSQVQHRADGQLTTAVTRMLHCSETHARDECMLITEDALCRVCLWLIRAMLVVCMHR